MPGGLFSAPRRLRDERVRNDHHRQRTHRAPSRVWCDAPVRQTRYGLAARSRERAARAAARRRAWRELHRYRRCIRPARQRRADRAGALSVSEGSHDCDEGRLHSSGRTLGARRTAGASARGLRGKFAAAAGRAHRPVSLHAVDAKVPLEEQVGALKTLREEGKISFVGLSNVDVEEIERARRIVDIVSVQNNYNVANRTSEAVLEYCERNGIAFIPYFPLDGGDLEAAQALAPIPARTRLRSGRLVWRGCSRARRRCCRYPEPRRSRIWKRTSPRGT